ncbi:fasciclin-2-like isoform X1 [Bradysia coprophila]|uniref:fasciclin-2-like isoform X1 n=2 Tax=Bradysia coprophila TaxID=38358 RepID=UPI00187D927B|nr:fasciclin-2-like isoform X1 [Bradysia coprophila]
MLLKLLIVLVSCKDLLCNAAAEAYYHEFEDGKPEIVNVDLVHDVKIGDSFAIDCLATEDPVQYKWSKEQQDIVNTDRFTVFAENGTMRVIRVDEADSGVYTCAASNSFGSSEQNFTVNVLVPPNIDEFENISIVVGTEGILTCKASGRPAPFVTFSWYGWKFTTPESSPFRDVIPAQVANEELGQTIATLNFTGAMRSYYGEYECLAENQIDSAKQIAYVTIEYPPDFNYMGNPSPAYSFHRRPVNVTCVARALPEATIAWYWNEKLISDLDPFFEVINSGSESMLVVEPVDDSYFTTYKCVASNKHGEAERIMEVREAQSPEVMADVMVRRWSIDWIAFEITASPTGTPAEFYKYQYKEDAELDWIDSVNVTRVVGPVTTVMVQGLKANTKYNFRFYAENEIGTSPFIELSEQTMCQYRYEEPKILNKISEDRAFEEVEFIESPYTDKFEMIWEPIIEPCEEIVQYSVEYCLASLMDFRSFSIYEGECRYIYGITSTNYVIGNLTTDSYYAIRLTGVRLSTSYHLMRTARDPITGGDPRLKIYPTYSLHSIAVGTFFNFTCKSKVDTITNLIWRNTFDNPINAKSSDDVMYTEIINDREVMLVIPFVKHAMSGTYYCESAAGSETIDTFVKIETYTLIRSSDELQYNFGVAGEDGYVSCSFYNVDDNTTVDWMFENNPIEPSDRYEYRIDEYPGFTTSYALLIHHLTEADEGFYTCRQSANERLMYHEVVVKPTILSNATEYSAVEGVDFAIDCPTLGKPAPIVKWVDRYEIDVTTRDSRFSVDRSGQMKIRHIEEGDEGRYTCQVVSIAGRDEKTVQLKVDPSEKNRGKSVHEYCVFTAFICLLLYTFQLK